MKWQRVRSGLLPFIHNRFPLPFADLRLSNSEQRLSFFLRSYIDFPEPPSVFFEREGLGVRKCGETKNPDIRREAEISSIMMRDLRDHSGEMKNPDIRKAAKGSLVKSILRDPAVVMDNPNIRRAVQNVLPSVVEVSFQGPNQKINTCCGIIVDSDGTIITSASLAVFGSEVSLSNLEVDVHPHPRYVSHKLSGVLSLVDSNNKIAIVKCNSDIPLPAVKLSNHPNYDVGVEVLYLLTDSMKKGKFPFRYVVEPGVIISSVMHHFYCDIRNPGGAFVNYDGELIAMGRVNKGLSVELICQMMKFAKKYEVPKIPWLGMNLKFLRGSRPYFSGGCLVCKKHYAKKSTPKNPTKPTTAKTTQPQEKRVQYRSNLCNVVKLLTEKKFTQIQMEKIKEVCPFWELCEAIFTGKLTEQQCRKSDQVIFQIVKKYNPNKRAFIMYNHQASITKDHIRKIFGITNPGKIKIAVSNETKTIDEFQHFVGKWFVDVNMMTKTSIEAALTEALKGKTKNDLEDVARLVTLYMLDTLFVPTSCMSLAWGYLKFILDVQKINSYDWVGYIYEKLMAVLNDDDTQGNSACIMVIPYMLLETFQICKPDEQKKDNPVLCTKWNLGEFFKLMKNNNSMEKLFSEKKGLSKPNEKEKKGKEKRKEAQQLQRKRKEGKEKRKQAQQLQRHRLCIATA